MTTQEITTRLEAVRAHFATGATLPIDARLEALRRLRTSILRHETELEAALKKDLNKSATESFMCETGMTLSELSYTEKHLRRWARPRRVLSPLAQFHATSRVLYEPYGVVLIMSPWNYPFMLTMEPLIGAIAAGNCCVVKPSAYSPATSEIISHILEECFPPEYVFTVRGGREENTALLEQRFDYIFFTGGVNVGREVMRRAAEHLTPVTLELGGKSPVIVDRTAKLKQSARRLVFGKLLNCGQTCVAPDYLLIDRTVKDEFLGYVKECIAEQYGTDALTNEGYVHMISRRHYDRVMGLIDPEKVILGGKGDPDTLAIQPTILDGVTPDDAVMCEEIFGPVLPVIAYDSIDEALALIDSRPHPLALYLFTKDRALEKRVLRSVRFGGGCVNDTIMHIASSRMPFGGVGGSGMGGYHGIDSFRTFSHAKSVLKKHTWLDMPVRYAPYTPLQRKLLRLFLR